MRWCPIAVAVSLSVVLAAPAPAAAKPPAGFVGITSEDVFAGNGVYRNATLALQSRIGIQLLRQSFSWREIEVAPNRYDLSAHDSYVATAAAHGIRILPILFAPPPWRSAGPSNDRQTYPPRDYADLGRFGAVLAARYGPNGTLWRQYPRLRKVPISSYQVWNEPNLPAYWPSGPNPRGYARLLAATAAEIRKIDKGAEIVTAGMPQSSFKGAMPLLRYLRGLYRAGAARSFDTLAINTYARDERDLRARLTGIRKLMKRYRDRAPIWATEIGWSDVGPRSEFRAGVAGQANKIQGSIRLLGQERRRLGLRGFVYFNWKDAPPYRSDGFDFWGLHAGLLRRDSTPKPAFAAFVKAVRQLR